MPKTTYATWDAVPEEEQLRALKKALRDPTIETDEQMGESLAKTLGIPVETIPPGEFGIR